MANLCIINLKDASKKISPVPVKLWKFPLKAIEGPFFRRFSLQQL